MVDWRKLRTALADRLGLEIRHSQERYAELLVELVRDGDRWLDIGCGRQIVPPWAAPAERQAAQVKRARMLVGMDVDGAIKEHPLLSHKVFGWADPMPFREDVFDLVTANMVVEHIERPKEILREIRRVLAPGGRFVLHTPNRRYYAIALARMAPRAVKAKLIWLLERRKEQDVFKTYYRINTPGDVRRLARESGFEVRTLVLGGSVGACLRLGPLGVLEVPVMKLLTLGRLKSLDATIIAVLVKSA